MSAGVERKPPDLDALRRHPATRALMAATGGATPVHLVGGAVRDALLGLPARDLDAVVAGRGESIAQRLAERLPARLVRVGGDRFAAYRLIARGFTLDLWDRGRQTLTADLKRRDFTVNTLALAPAGGRIFDPCNGRGDLAARRLRATTPQTFREDPLRLLRLARLAGQLGFTVDPVTKRLACRDASLLATVARERVREELERICDLEGADRATAILLETGLYPATFLGPDEAVAGCSEARASEGSRAAKRSRRQSRRSRVVAPNLVAALGRVLKAAAAFRAAAGPGVPPPRPELVHLALMLRHLPPVPAARPARLRAAGLLTRRQTRAVIVLLSWRRLPRATPDRRWLLHTCGDLWPSAICYLAVLNPPRRPATWSTTVARLADLVRREGDQIFHPRPLITADEATTLLGLPAGPELGEALRLLRRRQVTGALQTRAQAIAVLRELARQPT